MNTLLMESKPQSFNGLKLVESHTAPEFLPKIQLNINTPVTDKFRAEMNQWLLDMFGSQRNYFVWQGQFLIAHPNNISLLKMATQPKDMI